MPELPEVETVRRGLERWVVGKKFSQVRALHPRVLNPHSIAPLEVLEGARVKSVERRGKFLWFLLNRPETLVAHLGMSGQFLLQPITTGEVRHLRASFILGNSSVGNWGRSTRQLQFIDQRTFGWLAVDQLQDGIPTLVQHIARDPFDQEFNRKAIIAKIASRKTQIKKALLDQSVMSGVGNIYADESLWRAKIHPESYCEELSNAQIGRVIDKARQVMAQALEVGGTSFDDLYINVNGESGYFERSLAVYGQEGEPCPRCGREIRRIIFANRSSHFCPTCQAR